MNRRALMAKKGSQNNNFEATQSTKDGGKAQRVVSLGNLPDLLPPSSYMLPRSVLQKLCASQQQHYSSSTTTTNCVHHCWIGFGWWRRYPSRFTRYCKLWLPRMQCHYVFDGAKFGGCNIRMHSTRFLLSGTIGSSRVGFSTRRYQNRHAGN